MQAVQMAPEDPPIADKEAVQVGYGTAEMT